MSLTGLSPAAVALQVLEREALSTQELYRRMAPMMESYQPLGDVSKAVRLVLTLRAHELIEDGPSGICLTEKGREQAAADRQMMRSLLSLEAVPNLA